MKAGARNSNVVEGLLIHALLVVTVGSFIRCAPLASEMQSARLVGKKQVEVTPGYSTVQFVEEQSHNPEQVAQKSMGTVMGAQVAYGVSDKVDVRARAERINFRKLTTTVFSIGPKVSLIKDRVALYVPVWFVDLKPALFQPTVLFTLPVVKNRIEFNPSVKSILSVGGYDPNTACMVAVNAGLAISTNLNRWAIRPEYSVVHDVNKGIQYSNYSIGLSLNVSLLMNR